MTTRRTDQDRCTRCRAAGSCFLRDGTTMPVLGCDLFEDGGRTLTGLCVDCEHRFTCGRAHRAGGVWSCEDYR